MRPSHRSASSLWANFVAGKMEKKTLHPRDRVIMKITYRVQEMEFLGFLNLGSLPGLEKVLLEPRN
jgi:hypothetical protein